MKALGKTCLLSRLRELSDSVAGDIPTGVSIGCSGSGFLAIEVITGAVFFLKRGRWNMQHLHILLLRAFFATIYLSSYPYPCFVSRLGLRPPPTPHATLFSNYSAITPHSTSFP